MKGHPLDVLEKCSQKATRDGIQMQASVYERGDEYNPQRVNTEELDSREREIIKQQIAHYKDNSLRGTGFAYKDITLTDEAEMELVNAHDFVFIGLVCVRDDVRPDALHTIHTLQEALIDIKMMTGDTRINAVNVGRQLGMISPELADDEIERKSEIISEHNEH